LSFGFKLSGLPREEPVGGEYDVVIVGAGPAGLSAALYSARYGLKTVIVSKTLGGSVNEAPLVDDYLGLPDTPGSKLVEKFVNHVKKYGVPIIIDEVIDVKREQDKWRVETRGHKVFKGYVVILAMGSEKRKLNVPGEKEFTGRGVSYCATCDGPLFREKNVMVVGGGNSALSSALYLATIASKVILVHRRREFRAFKHYVQQVEKNPKISIMLNHVVKEIVGDDRVRRVVLIDNETGVEKTVEVDGVFIEIGSEPPKEFFKKMGVEVDEEGFAKINVDQSTNLPGIYVAGDSAGGPCKYRFEQIITAAAEGAKAVDAAYKYILSIAR